MTSKQMTFTDAVKLNSSVRPEDEGRLSRQAKQVLDLFMSAWKAGTTVTTTELMTVAGQYNARLYEVRRHLVSRGLCIDKVHREDSGVHHYKIVQLGDSEFYKANWFKFA